MAKTEVVSFRKNIPFNSSETLKERVKADGYLTEIRVRFYPGQELALRVKPYVKHKGNKDEDVFTYVGSTSNFLSGDDDYFVFPVSVDMRNDDEVCVFVENKDSINNYDLSVDMVISYISDGSDYL